MRQRLFNDDLTWTDRARDFDVKLERFLRDLIAQANEENICLRDLGSVLRAAVEAAILDAVLETQGQ